MVVSFHNRFSDWGEMWATCFLHIKFVELWRPYLSCCQYYTTSDWPLHMAWSLHSISIDNKCLPYKRGTIFKFWAKCNCCILKKPCQHFRKDRMIPLKQEFFWLQTQVIRSTFFSFGFQKIPQKIAKNFVCWGCQGRDWRHLWYFQHWTEIDLSGSNLGWWTTSTKLSEWCGCHGGWCVPWTKKDFWKIYPLTPPEA